MSLGTPPPATAPRGGNHRLALAGLLVGIAALAALAAAGLGYRLGWWPLGTAFVLAQVGAYGAVLACALSAAGLVLALRRRSEEHTSELQSLMRISYAVFCLKKKKKYTQKHS